MQSPNSPDSRLVRLLAAAVALGSLTQGCGYSEEQMQLERDRVTQLNATLGALEDKHRTLNKRFETVAAENALLNGQLKAMGLNAEDSKRRQEEMQLLIAQLQEREKQASARLATFRNMLERFHKMIASGKLRVRIVRNRMVVELAENILFDSGKADLKEEGKEALAEVAAVLQTIEGRDFQIAGHTDNVDIRTRKFPSNWHLSTTRAVTVTRFLGENGVDITRLSAAGHADTQPVASNDDATGRQQNRRIEIVLLPNLDELPDLSSLTDDPS